MNFHVWKRGSFFTILPVILLCVWFFTSFVSANASELDNSPLITFRLTNTGDDDILYVSLQKEGESSKNGMVRQEQSIEFNRERNEIIWDPCNDHACTVVSSSTAGGKTGRDQLILTITFRNSSAENDSCHGDFACERLQGITYVKSGMLEGIFKTGKTYEISVQSLKPGVGQAFELKETDAP